MLLFLIFGASVTNGMHFPLVYCLITQGVQPKPRVYFFNIFFHGLHNKQKQVITCFLVFLEGENGRDFRIFYQLRVEKGVMVQIPLFLSICKQMKHCWLITANKTLILSLTGSPFSLYFIQNTYSCSWKRSQMGHRDIRERVFSHPAKACV